MKYVFFDIECAAVFKNVAKICAFGYVVTDEQFNVLVREDVLLNPKGKFHLTDRKGGEGIVLPYEYEDFKKYPPFPSAYSKIKALLEDKEHIVLGHATMNDVKYLNLETQRYRLPPLEFSYYDTQFLYMNLTGDYSRQCGLGTIAEALDVQFTPHRAVDDAYATMRVCEAICKKENAGVLQLARKYNIVAGRTHRGKTFVADSAGHRAYLKKREEEKQARANAHEKFYRFVNSNMPRRAKTGPLFGKTFCFDKELENDVAVSTKLAGAIFQQGGKYTSHPTECHVFIARGEENPSRRAALEHGAEIIAYERFQTAVEGV